MYEISFLGGFLLGLASSLHCAGMCGPIASSVLIAFSPDGKLTKRTGIYALNQLGRMTAYVLAGALVGFIGDKAFLSLDREAGFALLRWAGAVALGWIGLSIAGWLPPLTFIDRLLAPVTRTLATAGPKARQRIPVFGPIISGLAWGLLPCGMVYGALFYALLSGQASTGGLVMAGFAIGTLPAITVTALGISTLRDAGKQQKLRLIIGLSIAVLAVLSIIVPSLNIGPWCRTP